ncbi:proteasome subunit protein [Helicosporidium sp. ATCC 50920]|nr:proteasome subunit protein [Helicosporidium sp. ATCC 50920]|eukprot:KDD75132.1 proteasome subunit protein [Helicosporidium sp. ATCC 50920]
MSRTAVWAADQAANQSLDPSSSSTVTLHAYAGDVRLQEWGWAASYAFGLRNNRPSDAPEEITLELSNGESVLAHRIFFDLARPDSDARLQTDALAPVSKLCIRSQATDFEAVINLPESETRDAPDIPEALWITMGDVEKSGVVFQLKVLKQHASWSPYDDNGGTIVAVAGEDYCLVGGSKRLSTGYSILTRDQSKICRLSSTVVVASAGMQADRQYLHKMLHAQHVMYQFSHRRPMSTGAVAQHLSNTLYSRRFFPLYTFNLCCGLDEQGRGAVYTYDAVGSHELVGFSCQGTGRELMQPVLDSQLKAASPLLLPPQNWRSSLPLDKAVDLVKDAFTAAGERDIYTGDDVEILIITKDGIQEQTLSLKRD